MNPATHHRICAEIQERHQKSIERLTAERDSYKADARKQSVELLIAKSFMIDAWGRISSIVTTSTKIPNTPYVLVKEDPMSDLRRFWESIESKIAAIDAAMKGQS